MNAEKSTRRQTCTDHCSTCGQHFHGLAAFDAHRAGSMDNRRCLTAAEMKCVATRSGRRLLQLWTGDGWCDHVKGCWVDGRRVRWEHPVAIWQEWMDKVRREALSDLRRKA